MLVNAAAPLNGRAYVFTRPDTCYEFTMRWINSAGACLRAALCLVVIAATPSYAVSIATLLPPPDTREIETTIERGHKLLLDEKYADASKAFDEVLQNGDFLQLTKGRQFRTLLLASQAASGREDYLAAHEYLVIATQYPDAAAEHWVLRAQFATWVDAWADAGLAIKTLAKTWPQSLAELDHEAVQWTIAQMARDKKLAGERLELLNALYDAKFQLEWHIEPSDLWRELVLQALERKDVARARDVLKRIESPGSLVRMRIDRRFDPIVQAEPTAFDVAAASQAECRKLRREMTANPTRLGPVVQYMYSLFSVGEYGEVISLADRVLAQNARAPKDKPAFDDVADTLNWIYDLKSQALRGLGRWDEALAIQQEARRQRETSTDKVSQAINLGGSYLVRNRPDDALKSLEGIDWARSLSGFGRMQLQHVRLRAYLQLGNREEAEKVFVYLRENKIDAPDTWQEAMLDWGDVDGAAALYIARLRDPEDRVSALYAAQTFKPVPRLPRQIEDVERWQKLLSRPDVTAAINEVGRREQHPLYDIWN